MQGQGNHCATRVFSELLALLTIRYFVNSRDNLRARRVRRRKFVKRGTKIVALICLWTIPALIFFLAFHYGWHSVWHTLGVHPVSPPFMDLRSIAAGVQTLQHGGNPLVINTFEALQRPLNYPKVWLYIFSFLGIHDQNVMMGALLVCALYLACI